MSTRVDRRRLGRLMLLTLTGVVAIALCLWTAVEAPALAGGSGCSNHNPILVTVAPSPGQVIERVSQSASAQIVLGLLIALLVGIPVVWLVRRYAFHRR
jgi:hypothetical protein